ncbi:MAG: T9SS type A sorting domain-containing protein [Ignavibacteriae bacterium]|nr:T9SS type A sorting domain-containing protein [Ignavibacteriota bacterium]
MRSPSRFPNIGAALLFAVLFLASVAGALAFPSGRGAAAASRVPGDPPKLLAPTLSLTKSSSVDTVQSGVMFTYTISYTVSSTNQDALNAVIVDSLPTGLDWTSAAVIGNAQVASSNVNTSTGVVTLTMISPLPAGSSGSVQINVMFPSGTTPNNLTVCNKARMTASNATATVSNLVCVVARAVHRFTFVKEHFIGNALNGSVIYRLRVINPAGNNIGGLNLNAASIKDTLIPGAVFVSATGGGSHLAGVVTWSIPTIAVSPWYQPAYYDFYLTVQYPSPPFTQNQTVCNRATLHGTPVGASPISLPDTACVTLVTAAPGVQFLKGPWWSPMPNRIPGCNGYYYLYPSNTGNAPVDSMKVTDILPTEVKVTSFTTGSYNNFSGGSVTVRYRTNVNAAWTTVGTYTTNTSINVYSAPISLPPVQFITQLQWDYGTVPVGFSTNAPPTINFTLQPNDLVTSAPVLVGDTITNCATLTSQFGGNPLTPITSCKTFTVASAAPSLSTYKSVISTGPYFPGDTVRYIMYLYNQGTAPLNNPVVVDNLPPGFSYAGGVTYSSLNGAPNPSTLGPSISTTPSTVTWNFSSPMPANSCTGPTYIYLIEFNAVIAQGTAPGNYCNTFTFGGSNHPTLNSNQACIVVNSVPTLESKKLVKGALDTAYAATGNTVSGGAVDYQLTITNTGNVTMKDILVVDILPYIGDVGVVNWSTARNSQWAPNLIGPVAAPPGVTVYYSLQTNPCRTDLTLAGPGGCVAPVWYTYAGLIGGGYNVTQVRSLKFDFGILTLAPLQTFTLTWPMTAPIGAPIGTVACNSFGYVAKRADNNAVIGPAEPQQVCIEIKQPNPAIYGDYVWNDLNQNGIQEAGEPGLNGVMVELWNVGPDVTAGTFDDYLAVNNSNVTIPFVMTANNMSSQPGYYQFTNLQPGTYYARFFPPPGFVVSLLNQGGNPQLDSDANPVFGPTYGWTVPVTLAANAIDTTWDMGVYFREQTPQNCKEYRAQALPIQGQKDCCWNVRFTRTTAVSSIRFTIQPANTITSTVPPAGWIATPQGGVYPTPSVTLVPPSAGNGIDTAMFCFNMVTPPVQLLFVEWLDAQGAVICRDTARIDCTPNTNTGNTGGVKFEDKNGNGVQDASEPGLADWPITLIPVGGGRPLITRTDARGRYRFDGIAPGTYHIVEEQRVGWAQTSPASGAHTIVVPPVDTSDHDFGNTTIPCTTPTDTINLSLGTTDNFVGPEASVIGPALTAWNSTNYNLPTIGFDRWNQEPMGWFFGQTFTGYAQQGCFVMGARLRIRLKAIGTGAANDGIGIVAGPNLAWYLPITGVSSNGFWAPNQTETIVLDLGNLPMGTNGATSVLAAIASGTFNIFVQNNTAVDFVELQIYICCPDELGTATLQGVKFHDVNCDGKWDPATEPTLPNWTINLSNGQTATTNNAGQWTLTVPAPGSYTVSEATVYPWYQSFPTSPGTYTVSVVPGQTVSNLNFGNCLKDTIIVVPVEHCDSLIGASLDTACCQYNFTIANNVASPITSISWSLVGATLNSMTTTPCTPVAAPAPGSTSGVLLFSPACVGNLGFNISVTPLLPSGLVGLQLVVHHGDKDSCVLITRFECDRTPLTRCDSVTVKPFVFVGLDLSGRTFTVYNVKVPVSPIVWIDIKPTPPPAFLQGGGLVIDGIGTPWSVPYTRIPLAGLISANTTVKFNLGVDYTLGWTGAITLVIHHADGDSCTYTYGPWSATPPTGGGTVVALPIQKRVYANRLRLQNTGQNTAVKWVSVQVVDRDDRIVGASGKYWDGTTLESGYARLSEYEQGQTEALFEFAERIAPGAVSPFFNLVVARDSAKSGAPTIRWTTYDGQGNALATDTVRITTQVLSIRGEQGSLPEGFDLLSSFPNPATGITTVNYMLGTAGDVILELYNHLGEQRAILDQGLRQRGLQSVQFNTSGLPAGTYYLRLSAGDAAVVRPMVVVK